MMEKAPPLFFSCSCCSLAGVALGDAFTTFGVGLSCSRTWWTSCLWSCERWRLCCPLTRTWGAGGCHGQTRLAWLGEHLRGGGAVDTQLRELSRRHGDDLPGLPSPFPWTWSWGPCVRFRRLAALPFRFIVFVSPPSHSGSSLSWADISCLHLYSSWALGVGSAPFS